MESVRETLETPMNKDMISYLYITMCRFTILQRAQFPVNVPSTCAPLTAVASAFYGLMMVDGLARGHPYQGFHDHKFIINHQIEYMCDSIKNMSS